MRRLRGDDRAAVWEAGEFGAFSLKAEEPVTAYRDTIGDMTVGLAGAVVAGLVSARRARQQPSEP